MARKSLMTTAKRVSSLGPDHSGAPKRGFFAKAGEAGLAVAHTPSATTNAKRPSTGNLARDGAAKRHNPVPHHNGMSSKAIAGAAGIGGGDASATPAGGQPAPSSHPFAKPPLAKTADAPIPVTRGMRGSTCRVNDPQAVADQAVKSGGKC